MKMSTNKVFLDVHIFDIPEGEEFVLIRRPIEPLVNPNGDRATLEVKVGNEKIPVSLVRSCNTIAEARPEQDPLEETVNISQEEQTQPIPEKDVSHFTQESDPTGKSKLSGEETPQPPLPELKPLPPGLKYALLHNNRATPVVISDKLTESETQRLVAVQENYRSVIGYSLQDLKGISPNLCTIASPWNQNISHQENINDSSMMR